MCAKITNGRTKKGSAELIITFAQLERLSHFSSFLFVSLHSWSRASPPGSLRWTTRAGYTSLEAFKPHWSYIILNRVTRCCKPWKFSFTFIFQRTILFVQFFKVAQSQKRARLHNSCPRIQFFFHPSPVHIGIYADTYKEKKIIDFKLILSRNHTPVVFLTRILGACIFFPFFSCCTTKYYFPSLYPSFFCRPRPPGVLHTQTCLLCRANGTVIGTFYDKNDKYSYSGNVIRW